MQGFTQRITTIKGLSERRRLPRLGRIRLGIKVPIKGKDPKRCECKGIGCFRCTRPCETPYFIVPPEVAKIYGDKPTELDIMVPVEDDGIVFPQSYRWYGSSRGLKCQGNLEIAYRYDEETKGIKEIACPCEKRDKDCKASSSLQVILPRVNFGGIYQITSGSVNSMIDISSGFDYARCLIGRVAMVPLKLRRVATETHHDGKKQIHYPLRVIMETNDPEFINTLREQTTKILMAPQALLPPPEIIRPDLDGPISIEWKEEEPQAQVEDDFLVAMEEQRKRIGEKHYLIILGNNGWERAEEIHSREEQIKIYKIMKAYPQESVNESSWVVLPKAIIKEEGQSGN